MKFDLRSPCGQCPFRGEHAFSLRAGRFEEIVEGLKDDKACFVCHKTLGKRDAEQACIGALAYMHRQGGYIPIVARLAFMSGLLPIGALEKVYGLLREPVPAKQRKRKLKEQK